MVTFIVVLILIAVVIAFSVLLIIKKGKLAKKWFISFGGVVLAGIICIAVAVPVTTNKVSSQADEYINYVNFLWERELGPYYNNFSQEDLQRYNSRYGEEIAEKNAWLEEWKNRVSTGIWWDVNVSISNGILNLPYIPHVVYENGEYVMIGEIPLG